MSIESMIAGVLGEPERKYDTYWAYRCPFHKGGKERHPSFFIDIKTARSRCYACADSWSFKRLLIELGYSKEESGALTQGYEEDIKIASLPTIAHNGAGAVDLQAYSYEMRKYLELNRQYPAQYINAYGFAIETLKHFDVRYDSSDCSVLFPVRDLDGNVIAVFKRFLKPGEHGRFARYRPNHIKEHPSVKTATFWNMHEVLKLKMDTVVVVEGFKACMRLWQYGLKNVVSSMGVAVTNKQIELLVNWFSKVFIFFDNNIAGKEGADIVYKRMLPRMPVEIISYGVVQKEQPDDLSYKEFLNMCEKYNFSLDKVI